MIIFLYFQEASDSSEIKLYKMSSKQGFLLMHTSSCSWVFLTFLMRVIFPDDPEGWPLDLPPILRNTQTNTHTQTFRPAFRRRWRSRRHPLSESNFALKAFFFSSMCLPCISMDTSHIFPNGKCQSFPPILCLLPKNQKVPSNNYSSFYFFLLLEDMYWNLIILICLHNHFVFNKDIILYNNCRFLQFLLCDNDCH